jgi:LmbE family N-acetylglucosaminyl deacetylase
MKKTVLAIGTHPDDIEIGCAGTLSILNNQGYELVFLVTTLGEEGSNLISKSKLSDIRKKEAQKSAHLLGASKIIFLGLPDGLTSFLKEDKIGLIKIL